MSAARPEGHRSERQIALIRPTAPGAESAGQALQLVESMLWALRGTLRSDWVSAANADAADVIVTTPAHHDRNRKAWQDSGKPVIVVAAQGEATSTDAHVLVYPFRATQFLQLLNE